MRAEGAQRRVTAARAGHGRVTAGPGGGTFAPQAKVTTAGPVTSGHGRGDVRPHFVNKSLTARSNAGRLGPATADKAATADTTGHSSRERAAVWSSLLNPF